MTWVPSYTEDALCDLQYLGKRVAGRVVNKVEEYCRADKPLSFAKRLQGPWSACYRFRVGEFRIIFKHLPSGGVQIIQIVKVAARRDLY